MLSATPFWHSMPMQCRMADCSNLQQLRQNLLADLAGDDALIHGAQQLRQICWS